MLEILNYKMVVLIHERYATYYHANKMSTTFVFCFAIYTLIIIVPFLIGFTTNGTEVCGDG